MSRMVWPGEVVAGVRLLAGLPGYLRGEIRPEQARATVGERLARRESDFLEFVRRAIYEQPASPYRALLKHAGCDHAELQHLIGREGLDGALRVLYRSGVYLTVEELKGRQEIVRGSLRLPAGLECLRNPLGLAQVRMTSSGSKGPSAAGLVNLASLRDQAVNQCLMLAARGGLEWQHAHWGVPGGEASARLLEYYRYGHRPLRRFTQIEPSAPGLHPRYRWSERALRLGSVLAGRPFRPLEHVPLDDPLPIALWSRQCRRGGRTPHLWTFSSPAVRLCVAALRAGLDLSGLQLTLSGEATTPARLATLRRAGASCLSYYASAETGLISYGCLASDEVDESHVLADLQALIRAEPDPAPAAPPEGTLLVSAIRPTARFVLLNASLGDRAELRPSACGCPFEAIGWTSQLRAIRSIEKLTAGGVTFLESDAVRAVEETLPARFGGGPTDYQLLEQERDDGQPCLRLLVNPTVGVAEPQQVGEAFLTALGTGSGAERVAALQWRRGGWLCVESRAPLATATGKIHAIRRHHSEGSDSSASESGGAARRPSGRRSSTTRT